jgi:hypothetical protein
MRIVIVVFRSALPRLCRRGEAILNIRPLLLTEQTTHGGGLRWLFTVTTLDTMLSLDGRNLTTSSCHLRRIRIDTSALVVHTRKDPVSKVLPPRKMYWFGRSRRSGRATGDRASSGNPGY